MARTSDRADRLGVLVVDDEPDVRELLTEFFRDHGCEVAATGDGRAAIVAVEREPMHYHLVLVDLLLPGADGLTVLRAVRAANPSACVVIITGYASLDSAIEAVRLGAYDYLTKPFSIGQIDVILQRVTERLNLQIENRLLARQLGGRPAPAPSLLPAPAPSADLAVVLDRLDALDGRLASVESLLRVIAGQRQR